MTGQSLTPQEVKLRQLQEIIPEAFAEGKIDWEKLKATLGEHINFSNERYVLNWAGKSDAFRILQTPTTKTLNPDKEESIDFDRSRNIFIEGENLDTLKALQRSYFGKIKMIYIDPPYNTGNDFVYNDKFTESKSEYQQKTGERDGEGNLLRDGLLRKNTKDSGHYHSNWLNMMYPRLFLARNLLREDGVIFVSIDDHEVHNLRLILNEIFGEENFVASLIWKKKQGGGNDSSHVVVEHEYILIYAKNANRQILNLDTKYQPDKSLYPYQDEKGEYGLVTLDKSSIRYSESLVFEIKDPSGKSYYPRIIKGKQSCWRWSKEKVEKDYDQLVFKDGKVYTKYYKPKGITPKSLLIDSIYGRTETGNDDIKSLFGNKKPFSYPKPVSLLKHLIMIGTNADDIILDFFAGSGTTAHAVMKMNAEDGGNRRYMLVQIPEPVAEDSEAAKAGYTHIAEIAKERIRRAAEQIKKEIEEKIQNKEKEITGLRNQLDFPRKEEKIQQLQTEIERLKQQDLGFKYFRLADSNFKQWRLPEHTNAEELEKELSLFVDPVKEEAVAENMVYELMLKNGLDLISHIESTGDYYRINNGELVLLLDKVDENIIRCIIADKPEKVIALDKLFKDNDQLKTNTVLQMKDAGIEFKTI